MRFKAFFLVALLFVFLLCEALASPGLKLGWVQYSPKSGRIVAEIFNDSNETAEGFAVDFFADDQKVGTFWENGEAQLELAPHSIMQVYQNFPNDRKTHGFSAVVYAAGEESNGTTGENSASEKFLGEADRQRLLEEKGKGTNAGESGFMQIAAVAALALVLAIIIIFAIMKVRKK